MTKAMKRRPRGFSLLEVMISAALFALTVTGVVTSTRMLTDQAAHSRQMTRAIHLAEFTMEELLLRFSGDDDLRTDLAHSREFDINGEPCATGTGVYVATWTISQIPAVPQLNKVNVVLSWKENNVTKSVNLITYRP